MDMVYLNVIKSLAICIFFLSSLCIGIMDSFIFIFNFSYAINWIISVLRKQELIAFLLFSLLYFPLYIYDKSIFL